MPPDETAGLVQADLLAGRYLTARARLRAAGTGRLGDLWNTWFWTLVAIDPWHEGWPLEPGEPQAPADTLASAEPGGLGVVAAAAGRAVAVGRVVVLMERHTLPESRWAGVRLLPALRSAGATHLAFETTHQRPIDRAQREGVVRAETVPYAFDPSRAALVRTAIRLGLRLVAFDDPTDVNGLRERRMADNVHRLLTHEPGARIVVWTGGQHAWKRMPDYYSVPLFSGWARDRTMGAVLAELAGKEPFCVGQAVLRGSEHEAPRAVGADHPWAAEHGLDAVLVHVRGARPLRPSWIDEGRRPVALPAGGALLVQAIPEAEGPDAVPAEQAIARAATVRLTLAPGRYRCRGLDDADRPVWQRSVEVDG